MSEARFCWKCVHVVLLCVYACAHAHAVTYMCCMYNDAFHLGENGKEVINQNAGYIMTLPPTPSTPYNGNQDFKWLLLLAGNGPEYLSCFLQRLNDKVWWLLIGSNLFAVSWFLFGQILYSPHAEFQPSWESQRSFEKLILPFSKFWYVFLDYINQQAYSY